MSITYVNRKNYFHIHNKLLYIHSNSTWNKYCLHTNKKFCVCNSFKLYIKNCNWCKIIFVHFSSSKHVRIEIKTSIPNSYLGSNADMDFGDEILSCYLHTIVTHILIIDRMSLVNQIIL